MTIHRARQASACPLLSRRTAEAAGGAAPGRAGLHNEAHLLPLRCRPPGPSGARACTPEHRGPAQGPETSLAGPGPPKGKDGATGLAPWAEPSPSCPATWWPPGPPHRGAGRRHERPRGTGGDRGRGAGATHSGLPAAAGRAPADSSPDPWGPAHHREPVVGPSARTGSHTVAAQRGLRGGHTHPPESLVATDGPSLARGCPGVRQGIREGPQSRGRGLRPRLPSPKHRPPPPPAQQEVRACRLLERRGDPVLSPASSGLRAQAAPPATDGQKTEPGRAEPRARRPQPLCVHGRELPPHSSAPPQDTPGKQRLVG